MKTDKVPNPGSDEAIELGCVCPHLDNEYGEGSAGMFYVNMECNLHKHDPNLPKLDTN